MRDHRRQERLQHMGDGMDVQVEGQAIARVLGRQQIPRIDIARAVEQHVYRAGPLTKARNSGRVEQVEHFGRAAVQRRQRLGIAVDGDHVRAFRREQFGGGAADALACPRDDRPLRL